MYQNVNYNQPPPPSNPFDSPMGSYGAQPIQQHNYAPGYQPGPPAYTFNPNPAPQYAPTMHQPMMTPDNSMNGGKLSPACDEQIRSTLCCDVVLNTLTFMGVAMPLMVSIYGIPFAIWFFYVWIKSILAQRRYSSSLMPSYEKRLTMNDYAGTRNSHLIILWVLWGLCFGVYLYIIFIIAILTNWNRGGSDANATLTLVFIGVSFVLVGQAVYTSKTQKHIILASVQA